MSKQTKRHKDRDGLVKSIRITGNNIVENILNWLYSGEERHSLPRKYEKYKQIVHYMNEYRREKCNV